MLTEVVDYVLRGGLRWVALRSWRMLRGLGG